MNSSGSYATVCVAMRRAEVRRYASSLSASSVGLAVYPLESYTSTMITRSEIEQFALQLSEADRAVLAAHLLDSLPGVLADEDDGIAEALRRDAELDRDPGAAISHDELKRLLESSR
jgi:hypothetical protein